MFPFEKKITECELRSGRMWEINALAKSLLTIVEGPNMTSGDQFILDIKYIIAHDT